VITLIEAGEKSDCVEIKKPNGKNKAAQKEARHTY
jgi:hypothetical protein